MEPAELQAQPAGGEREHGMHARAVQPGGNLYPHTSANKGGGATPRASPCMCSALVHVYHTQAFHSMHAHMLLEGGGGLSRTGPHHAGLAGRIACRLCVLAGTKHSFMELALARDACAPQDMLVLRVLETEVDGKQAALA